MSDDGFVIEIDGKSFDLLDLTWDEVEEIEEVFDKAWAELDFGRAKVMRRVVFTLMRRDDPNLNVDDLGGIQILRDMTASGQKRPEVAAVAG